jgi:glutamate/tyrosine decarboxylase-like PLP-dependent enzyme
MRELLERTARLAAEFLESLDERPVLPEVDVDALRAALAVPLPPAPTEPSAVVQELVEAATPGIAGMPSARWYGFVIGGSLPAALAADWLTSTWDQNAGLFGPAPAAAVVEEVAGEWLRELFGLPEGVSFAFVTGCQMAHVTALAAARHRLLADAGWDVEADGLQGAPPIRALVCEERHVTLDRALRLLGLGTAFIEPVAVDERGAMRADALEAALAGADGPTLVCAQAGNVNTGACDPFAPIVAACREHGAWCHVDGAFGLWAAVAPARAHLVAGVDGADSWAVDAHKWLNVPYDAALAFVADPAPLRAAVALVAPYLTTAAPRERNGSDWSPEASRRARAFPLYAALRQLGRHGVAELVERHCALAARIAARLDAEPGVAVLNDVVLNQALVRFGDDDAATNVTIARVQGDGTCWVGGTRWHDVGAMRISVSGWQTNEADADRAADAILGAWRAQ